MKKIPFILRCCVLLLACGGNVSEAIVAKRFEAIAITSMLDLSATRSFADERGGGIFIDLAGRVVRVRADGTQGLIESHPANAVAPGRASAVWPLGPYTALVETERGLFIAESGWLVAPAWQTLLPPEGLIATAVGDNGIGWLAHENGLFRLESGLLTELKVAGSSVQGLTAMGIAPSSDGSTGVWFAQGERVSNAAQTSKLEFVIKDSGIDKKSLAGGVIGMAGIAASPSSPGELWAITPKSLFQFTVAEGWRKYELGRTPKQVISAGRVAWLQSGDELFRYDADAQSWGRAQTLEAVPVLLAVDASGAAWVRTGETTSLISPTLPIRIDGLFQNAKVYASELVVQTTFSKLTALTALNWSFDAEPARDLAVTDGQPGVGPQASLRFYSLGGNEASGVAKTISFAALADGMHTLSVTALTEAGLTTRALHFDLHASSTAILSFEADIRPISESRCAKCHSTGTLPELKTFAQWQTEAEKVLSAVRDRRMPADGPLDPSGIQAIQRWVNGGMQP